MGASLGDLIFGLISALLSLVKGGRISDQGEGRIFKQSCIWNTVLNLLIDADKSTDTKQFTFFVGELFFLMVVVMVYLVFLRERLTIPS